MKKRHKVIGVCTILLLIIIYVVKILPLFLPIKYAVKTLPNGAGEYIVVEGVVTTGYEWYVVGDQDGLYPEYSQNIKCINMCGNTPIYSFNSMDNTGDNKFICYGKYVYKPYDGVRGHNIYGENVFDVEQWDIIYPIQRDLFIGAMIPKNYLCRYDIYYDKKYTFGEMLKGLYVWNYKTLPY